MAFFSDKVLNNSSFLLHEQKKRNKDDYFGLLAQAAWLFIFLLHEQKKNETKRKFAGCIFLPTPALFSTKQKELAIAQTAFCF